MATIVKQICGFCNCEFTSKKGKEKQFCSNKCKKENRSVKDSVFYVEKICKHCEKLFKSKAKFNLVFCSRKCSDEHKKETNREYRTCVECDNVFIEKISRKRMFCSDVCRRMWQGKSENVEIRLKAARKSTQGKYGVDNSFQVESIRKHANDESRKIYKLRGSEIIKNSLLKLENKRQNKLIERFNELGYNILEFNDKNIKVQHPDGHIFENNRKLIVSRLNHNVELSTTIQPIGSPRTTFERKICKYLDDNNINYVPNSRKIIKGELDIYIPGFGLAIEINGLHWHSDMYRDSNYHLNKTNQCNALGIKLLHFFEDELIKKYDQVESIIGNKIGVRVFQTNIDSLRVEEINLETSTKFLKSNHVNNFFKSSINFGLFSEDELIYIATFEKINSTDYKLIQYSTKIDKHISDGLLLILKHFDLKFSPSNLFYFSDIRFSEDIFCKSLGFVEISRTEPNYWFVDGKKRIDKDDLSLKNTERIKKLNRIYDCGSIEYCKCFDLF